MTPWTQSGTSGADHQAVFDTDAEFAQLAIKRRAADAEAAGDFGHPAAIVPDGEADDIGLDFLERAQVAVVGVEQHADPARPALAAQGIVAEQFGQLREAFRSQRFAVAEDRGTEKDSLQLANIARPVIGFEQREAAVGDGMVLQARLFRDARQEIAGEGRNIAQPFAQRRQVDAGG